MHKPFVDIPSFCIVPAGTLAKWKKGLHMDDSRFRQLLGTLNNDQYNLLVLMARDYNDDEIVKELVWAKHVQWTTVNQLFKIFEVDPNTYVASCELLKTWGRRNGLRTASIRREDGDGVDGVSDHAISGDTQEMGEATAGDDAEIANDDGGEDGDVNAEGDGDDIVSSGGTVERPDVNDVVNALSKLKPAQIELFEAMVSMKRGDGERGRLAQRLGISSAALAARYNSVLKKIGGAGRFSGRKKFLQEVLATYKGRQPRQQVEGGRQRSRAVDSTSAREQTHPAPVVMEPTAQVPTNGHSDTYPAAPAAVPQGQGVAISIPATVEDVDVVSGQFTGSHPARGLHNAVAERKKSGFKPSVLVLTTTNDPSITHGQVVFFRHEDDKK